MSFLTKAYLLDKYGPRLSVEQIAAALGYHVHSVYNMIARGEFPIPTYKEGGRRYASFEDVADFFDSQREKAREDLSRASSEPG